MEYVVNACDAGREGELIFKRVYDLSKSSLPVKRLWISSMEEQAICDGFSNLKNGKEYERLCEAAVCRAKADWLVGMNATRAFTTTYYKRMVVGRVQTPTLAMLVERQKKVENFEKEAYYQVELPVLDFFVTSEKMKKEEEADALVKMCEGNPIHILKVERKQKKTNPPSYRIEYKILYNANTRFSISIKINIHIRYFYLRFNSINTESRIVVQQDFGKQ